MNLSPEEREVGRDNFHSVLGVTRREFLAGSVAAASVSGASLGAFYFSYNQVKDPLRVGIIGTGDEGSVLIGAINPDFIDVRAIADIRPYNVYRAFHGDESSDNALRVRPGLMTKYGWKSESEARGHVNVYTDSYQELLDDPDIEAVIIALPLHLHRDATVAALEAGKHVLCEKLMAHNVGECKDMARAAQQTGKILSIGHQRHYSILYDNAVDTLKRGLLGDIHYIRALWHRGNMPGKDSWSPPMPDDAMISKIKGWEKDIAGGMKGKRLSDRLRLIRVHKARLEDRTVEADKHGYQEREMEDGSVRSALEELIRWRLWARTGGGLMAELGGHQLDAASIFLSSLRAQAAEEEESGAKPRRSILPLSVSGVGGRHLFPADRDIDDHVYCSLEFPGIGYEEDPNKKVVVTYSSINGNGFGGYGETIFGTKGTMILEREQEVLLYRGSSTSSRVTVKAGGSDGPTLDTTESGGGPPAAAAGAALKAGPPSRGYAEEMEHFAWCIRNPDPENQPRCNAEIGLADAVMALSSNLAMAKRQQIAFEASWFDINSDETPEGIPPTVPVAEVASRGGRSS